ncbi:putative ribonuclease H-like domain-containing protein [Tanacetum coccineum]
MTFVHEMRKLLLPSTDHILWDIYQWRPCQTVPASLVSTTKHSLARQRDKRKKQLRKALNILLSAISDRQLLSCHDATQMQNTFMDSHNKQDFGVDYNDSRGQPGLDELELDDLYNNLKLTFAYDGTVLMVEQDDWSMELWARTSIKLKEQFSKRVVSEILGYQMSLESLEVILKTHEKNEYAWGDKYEQMEYDLKMRDLKLEEKQKELDQVLKERDDFKVKLEKWTNASVLQNEVLNKQRYLSDKSCIGFGVESSSSKESDNSSGDETLTDPLYENFKREKAYKAVPPPTGTIIPPRANVSFTGIDELAIRNKVVNQEKTKSSQPKIDRNKVIIEDWVDSDDEETVLNFSEIQQKTVLNSENSETSFENRSPKSQDSVGQESRKKGVGHKGGKTCFVCYSPDHLIKDCNLHERTFKQTQPHKPKGTQGSRDTRPVWNNINRVNHSNFSGNSRYPHQKRSFTPSAVLTREGLKSTARPKMTQTVPSKSTANVFYQGTARPRVPHAVLSQSTGRPYYPRMDNIRPRISSFSPSTRSSTTRTPHRPQRPKKLMKSIWVKKESTVGSQAVLPQNVSVKRSAMIKPTQTWRPKGAYLDSVNRDNGSYTLKQFEYGNPEEDLKDYAIIDSGCSGSMTGDKDKLSDFKEFKGGYVAFGNDPKGGRITGKGTIKTSCIDFEKVSYVEELKFNLLSVSQICDKKHNVLFTDKECLILSPKFKFVDEDLVILRAPRKNDVYSLDLKNIIPSGGVTCLVAKATKDEAVLWHRRLGHVNFKNINKLVKGNLVRGLPSKTFKLDHSCLACRKGKQHRASCKKIEERTVREPLELLHMDLFGPVSVESVNRKKYCLVVTDDCSKFSWVFFLAYKDETYDMLHDLIVGLENKLRHKVKTIRCDHGTEFKNHLMNEFCAKKGIKREYSIARTPQQNGVAERKNRTLIEAARTMLADSLLPIQFWAEAVNTACYVLNRVLVTKPQMKTPYEILMGRSPNISFMRPFGCPLTILNTLDQLGKFDGKSEEGYLLGYSTSSKGFRVYNRIYDVQAVHCFIQLRDLHQRNVLMPNDVPIVLVSTNDYGDDIPEKDGCFSTKLLCMMKYRYLRRRGELAELDRQKGSFFVCHSTPTLEFIKEFILKSHDSLAKILRGFKQKKKANYDESTSVKTPERKTQDILNKFDFRTIKPESTLIEAHKSLGKDEEGEDVDLQVVSAQVRSIVLNKLLEGSRRPQDFIPSVSLPSKVFTFMRKHSPKAASSARGAHGSPTQSAAPSQGTASVQGTACISRYCFVPKSPMDYTPQRCVSNIWRDEGLLDIYVLNMEVKRLKRQTLSQAKQILKLKAKLKKLSKFVQPVVEGTLSEEHYVQEEDTADPFFDDIVDKDAAVAPDIDRKSNENRKCEIQEEWIWRLLQSTARQVVTYYSKDPNFEDEQTKRFGHSGSIQLNLTTSQGTDPKDKGKGILVEEPKKKKMTLQQIRALETTNDEEVARKIQAEWDAEEEGKRFEELKKAKTTLRKPTSLAQERNQMMNFLKGQGYKNLQKLKYPQMKELFEKNAQDRESLEGISMITELQVIDSPDGEFKKMECIRWRFHEISGVRTLEIDDGTYDSMLAGKRLSSIKRVDDKDARSWHWMLK